MVVIIVLLVKGLRISFVSVLVNYTLRNIFKLNSQ